MVVQHNLRAMNANRMLNVTSNEQSKSSEKLSSGYRINRAADDAAGLSISEKMRSQIRGLNQASRNSQDGISVVQTAEGALAEVTDMLQRMNELSVQAANDTNNTDQRGYIKAEIDALVSEIDRIGTDTKFNETVLFDGSFDCNIQAGPSDDSVQINIKLDTALSSTDLGIDGLDVTDADNARTSIGSIKDAIETVSGMRSDLGAIQNRLEHTIKNLDNISENTSAAESRIRDTDMSTEMVKYTNNNILAQAGQAMLAQSNQSNQGVLTLLQ